MSVAVISTSEVAACLKNRYKDLDVPTYKLKRWFATDQRVFFDCDHSDKNSCLKTMLSTPDFPAFRIHLVVKDVASDAHNFMDVRFRNLGGKETLEHFMNRYHKQLETMTKLSLHGAGREYTHCVGHSYEEKAP